MIGNLTASSIAVVIVSLVISMVIHEYMHALTAHALGDTTAQDQGRMSLNPLQHIDPFMTIILPIATYLILGFPFLAAKPVPFNPNRVKYGEYGAALVALAGPLSNLVLAFLGAIVLNSTSGTGFMAQAIDTFTYLNVLLFVFNILPIPPLDGSRVLYAVAPESVQEVMRNIEPYGLFIVIGLVLAGHNLLVNIDQFVFNLLP